MLLSKVPSHFSQIGWRRQTSDYNHSIHVLCMLYKCNYNAMESLLWQSYEQYAKQAHRVTKTQIHLMIQCQGEGQLWKGFKLSKLSIKRWWAGIKKEKRWRGGRGEEQNWSLLTHGHIEDGRGWGQRERRNAETLKWAPSREVQAEPSKQWEIWSKRLTIIFYFLFLLLLMINLCIFTVTYTPTDCKKV